MFCNIHYRIKGLGPFKKEPIRAEGWSKLSQLWRPVLHEPHPVPGNKALISKGLEQISWWWRVPDAKWPELHCPDGTKILGGNQFADLGRSHNLWFSMDKDQGQESNLHGPCSLQESWTPSGKSYRAPSWNMPSCCKQLCGIHFSPSTHSQVLPPQGKRHHFYIIPS